METNSESHISKDDDDDSDDREITIHVTCEEEKTDSLEKSAELSSAVATGVYLARDLGNSPPNDL